jgi:hypothetical protein
MWASNYIAGLIVGCALGVGLVLFVKNSLPFDLIGVGFVLALCGTLFNWAVVYEARKSSDTLQTRALGILKELIRKDLLTVSISIKEPPTSLSCPVQKALTSVPINGRPGIELLLNRQFKLLADEETGIRDALRRMTKPRESNG